MKNKFDKIKKIWYDVIESIFWVVIFVIIPIYTAYCLYYLFYVYGK